jgi:hypothetical protein
MMPGSELQNMKRPNFQVLLSAKIDKVIHQIGCGFLTGNSLCTANHVLSVEEMFVQGPNGVAVIPSSRFKLLDADVAVATLSPVEISSLGLVSAKLPANSIEAHTGVFASVVSATTGSLGFLEPNRNTGFVTYTGSTLSGFSGAPYFVGRTVFGMHVGGSTQNVGYDGAFLRMLLEKKHESSEDIMFSMAKNQKLSFERSPFDPDEYRVKIKGQYFTVDEEQMIRLKNKTKISYDPESAIPFGNPLTGYSDGLDEFRGDASFLDARVPEIGRSQVEMPAPSQNSDTQPGLSSTPPQTSQNPTASQGSTFAQANKAFDATFASLSWLRVDANRLRAKLFERRGDLYAESSLLGTAKELENAVQQLSKLAFDQLSNERWKI